MNIKKAVILGTLGAILVGLCSFAFSKYTPKTTTPTIKAVYADEEETAIGSWYLNDTLNLPDTSTSYFINYTTNVDSTEYTTLSLFKTAQSKSLLYMKRLITINAYKVYIVEVPPETLQKWQYESINYRVINITGGTHVTNQNLISWLNQNATKLPTTIKNTSWKIKNTIKADSAYGDFSINFYSNGFKYNTIKIGYYANTIDTLTATQNAFVFNTSYNIYNDGTWQHERQWSRITITDGTDTTNIKLIAWLYQNAQQMQFISNPINTKWTFENAISTISISDNFYNIQFTTGRKQSFFMRVGRATDTIDYAIKTNNENAYTLNNVYNTYWLNPSYQTIIITGTETIMNSGVSDTFLVISFLQSNANGTSYTPIPTNPDDYDIEDGNFTSLQSIIFRILTLPFTFIAQAFNVTLWEGTAWEFNISNFILAIIAISAVLFIIKLFTSGLSILGNYTSSRAETKLTRSKTKLNKQKIKANKAENAKKE